MTSATKERKSRAAEKAAKMTGQDGELLNKDEMHSSAQLKSLDDKTVLKKTPPPEVAHAGEYWLKKKAETNSAKNTEANAFEALLQIMRENEVTQVTVHDEKGVPFILLRTDGGEKIKVTKTTEGIGIDA